MISNYTNKVKEIISSHKTGWVFTHVDFNELGNVSTIERILSRLVESGDIKRIRRGIYYVPEHSRWGEVPPLQSDIVKALAKSMNVSFLPDGANALHQLGLTKQIPMKQVYLTDKQISTISIGKVNIEFRKVSPQKLSGADSIAGVYLSAIEYLGKEEALQESVKSQVARTLDKNKINELKHASQNRAAWVREVVADILQKVS
jgi:predicted transcriptional regulator of viral defense system